MSRTHISYVELSNTMKKALTAQYSRDENNDAVTVDNVYFGGGVMCRLQLIKLMPTSQPVWVIYGCFGVDSTEDATPEDIDMYDSGDTYLKKAVSGFFVENYGDGSEMMDEVEIDEGELDRLNDIIVGQMSLF